MLRMEKLDSISSDPLRALVKILAWKKYILYYTEKWLFSVSVWHVIYVLFSCGRCCFYSYSTEFWQMLFKKRKMMVSLHWDSVTYVLFYGICRYLWYFINISCYDFSHLISILQFKRSTVDYYFFNLAVGHPLCIRFSQHKDVAFGILSVQLLMFLSSFCRTSMMD